MRVRLSIGRSLREYADVIVEAESVETAAAYVQAFLAGGAFGADAATYCHMVNALSWQQGDEVFDERVLTDSAEAHVDQDEDADVTVPEGWQAPATTDEADDEAARGGKDSAALLAIHALLDGREWDTDTLDSIAEIVRGTGRTVRDSECGTEAS